MAQYITKIIDSHVKGTTFKGIGFLIKSGPDAEHLEPLNLLSAKMELKVSDNAPASLTLLSGSGLTINSEPGLVAIDKQIIDVDAFNYSYEIEVTTTDNEKYIYIKGKWEIIN